MQLKELIAKLKPVDKTAVLAEKIKSLEDRIFEKKQEKKSSLRDMLYSYTWGFDYEPETLEKEITDLQDKFDALCKAVGAEVNQKSAQDAEWVATLKRVKVSKPKKHHKSKK